MRIAQMKSISAAGSTDAKAEAVISFFQANPFAIVPIFFVGLIIIWKLFKFANGE